MKLLANINENEDTINVEYLKKNAAVNKNADPLEIYVQGTEPTPEEGKNILWVQSQPSKTYTDLIADSGTNNEAGCAFYFGSIRPTSFTETWEVRYRVRSWVPGNTNYEAISEVYFTGDQASINAYAIFNHIYSTSYKPLGYHCVHRLKQAGYTAGYGHAIGVNLQDANNRDNTSLKRSVFVEVIYQNHCTVTLNDTAVKWANWTGTGTTNYNDIGNYNFSSNGLQETGDSNDIGILRSYYERPLVGDETNLFPQNLCSYTSSDKVQPFVSSYSTGTSKTKNTSTFRIGAPIFFYASWTEKAKGSNYPPDNTMALANNGISLQYSTNCGTTLTLNKPVYLVGIPSGSTYTLDDVWWTQTLPSTEDGKIYIHLGYTYSNYQISWQPFHPIYWYKNGGIELYSSSAGSVTSVTINATSPITVNDSSAITSSGTRTLSHANSGVTAGTYKSVTVNATGHVTAGTNPTTLSGYGITDAKIASGVITLGSNTITPLTSTQLTNQNLNDMKTPGLYYAGGSNSTTNKPSGVDAYGLKAFKTAGGYVTQELVEGNTTPGKRWTRQFDGSSWNTWTEMKMTDNDTKNTAGSTDTSSKIFLIGATSQAANPQTYSHDTAYVGTDGKLYSNSKEVVNLSDSQALTNKTYNGYTLGDASAKGVVTSVDTSANLPTSNAVKTFVEGKGYITNTGSTSGNAGSATKLETARTIGIGTGATGTATSFNGTANITIPVTDVKEAYVTWGGKAMTTISPDDMGCIDEFGHNKLAYLPASCVTVEYTTDGGTTWLDYGKSDTDKIALTTTTGSSCTIGKGAASASGGTMTNANCGNYQVRVKISTRDSNGTARLYTAGKKWLINYSTNGAGGCKVKIEYRTIANYNNNVDSWTTVGTYDIAGWSGWNSYPATTFGGSSTQTSQIADYRFTTYITSVNTSYSCQACFVDFRLIGGTNWTMPSELARAGHLYNIDTDQNASFPGNILPKVNNSKTLGNSSYKWNNIYSTTFTGNLTGNVTGNLTGTASKATGDKNGNDITTTYQPTLVSGTNIKTINNTSLLGSGNITIQGGGTTVVAGTGLAFNGDTLNHSNSVTAATSYVGSATAVPQIKYDAQGHITGTTTATIYPPTTAGTSGQYWKSDGSGQGVWQSLSTSPTSGDTTSITSGGVYTNTALNKTGSPLEVYTQTSAPTPASGKNMLWIDSDSTPSKYLRDSIPIGTIASYGAVTPPDGWLLCDGRAVSRTTYSALFAVIGTYYGTGDGSTTFNLPNLKGKIPVGYDSSQTEFNTVGKSGGEKTHTLTTTEMPAHRHAHPYYNYAVAGGGNANGIAYNITNTVKVGDDYAGMANTGGGAAHNNLQPYQVTIYIIKASDVVPIADTASIVNSYSTSTTNGYSANYVNGQLGDLTNLTTTSKTNLVSALNEVNVSAGFVKHYIEARLSSRYTVTPAAWTHAKVLLDAVTYQKGSFAFANNGVAITSGVSMVLVIAHMNIGGQDGGEVDLHIHKGTSNNLGSGIVWATDTSRGLLSLDAFAIVPVQNGDYLYLVRSGGNTTQTTIYEDTKLIVIGLA